MFVILPQKRRLLLSAVLTMNILEARQALWTGSFANICGLNRGWYHGSSHSVQQMIDTLFTVNCQTNIFDELCQVPRKLMR